MIVAIAMLALAVFSWGIRYKVSLYNSATHMSEAKLLSQKERPATSESTKLVADPATNRGPTTLFGLAIGAMLAGLCFRKQAFSPRNVCHQTQLPRQSNQTFFFFRPPPFLFASR
jgi:hypothetical protein